MPSRIYSQYRDKPKAVQWYNIVPDISASIVETAARVRSSYDIDNATSYELDVIGDIVVITRSFESDISPINENLIEFGGVQFGEDVAQFNAVLVEPISPEFSDEVFKILIKAKISKNNNDGTIDGMLDALSFIIPDNTSKIIDHDDMSFSVSFALPLTSTQILILNTFDILPRPQGVRFRGYTVEATLTQFGQAYFGEPNTQFGVYFGE